MALARLYHPRNPRNGDRGMSKATRWVVDAHEAKEHAARLARERPKLRIDGILAAEVGESGECILHLVSTGSDRALQIGQWIIDTFGDTPTSPTSEGASHD